MKFKLSIEEVRLILNALGEYSPKCTPESVAPIVLKTMLSSSQEEVEARIQKAMLDHAGQHEATAERVTLLRAKLIGIRDEMSIEEVTSEGA